MLYGVGVSWLIVRWPLKYALCCTVLYCTVGVGALVPQHAQSGPHDETALFVSGDPAQGEEAP